MAECELADNLLDSEEIVEKVKKFLEEGCGCSQGVKGGHCSQQFQKEVVLCNLNNCLELSHGKLRDVTLVVILTRAGQRATNRRFIELCHSCTLFFAKKSKAF